MNPKITFIIILVGLYLIFSNVNYEFGSLGLSGRHGKGLDFLLALADTVFSNGYVVIGAVIFVILFVHKQ